MLIDGKPYRTIWPAADGLSVHILDQRQLPFAVVVETISDWRAMEAAIREMHVRGAPLIGAAAAYGVWLACLEAAAGPAEQFSARVEAAMAELLASRPTAINLRWAVERQRKVLRDLGVLPASVGKPPVPNPATVAAAVQNSRRVADAVAEDDVSICAALGRHGADYLQQLAARNLGRPLRVLTHCNAGWLATVDHGTVTAVIYEARRRGLDLQVWVDETRPRNQGAMTAWELSQNGVPNTVICDNTGGHLMQNGLVDVVIVGTDRTVRNGDTANKIGTYLKALAAHDNTVPFFIALPSPSFDPSLATGVGVIPIEERDPAEVLCLRGRPQAVVAGAQSAIAAVQPAAADPGLQTIDLFAPGTKAANYGFDVTPARLITGYITEYGIFDAGGLADGLAAGAGHGR